jgi:hypothetical protein
LPGIVAEAAPVISDHCPLELTSIDLKDR